MYREGGYRANLFEESFTKENVLNWIADEMRQNRPVVISANVGGGVHANVVRGIRYLDDFSRFRISTMNPINGAYINPRNFNSYQSLFSVWRN